MENIPLYLSNLLNQVEIVNSKYELSLNLPEDYFEPGMMENLDQFKGLYDKDNKIINITSDVKGLRYNDRTQCLENMNIGDTVKIIRNPENAFNPNNFNVATSKNDDLGTLSAELCNAIAPLYDLGYLSIDDSIVTYIECLEQRSRYAKQGVLFVQITLKLLGM